MTDAKKPSSQAELQKRAHFKRSGELGQSAKNYETLERGVQVVQEVRLTSEQRSSLFPGVHRRKNRSFLTEQ